MSKVKIELTHSIEIDGAKISVIQLRRPKVRDMLSVEKSVDNDAEKEIQVCQQGDFLLKAFLSIPSRSSP